MNAKRATKLTEQIKDAIADHVAEREDAHGFSKLDALLGEVEAKGPAYHHQLEEVLSAQLPTLKDGDQRVWESVRMIVEAAGMRSPSIRNCIIGILDDLDEPRDAAARFQAFLAFKAAGGILTRPRLDEEKGLHDRLTPQWVDLALSAYNGAPENIISLVVEQLRDKRGKFTWEDVRRRLPLLFRLLGAEFNRGIVRITHAVSSKPEREKLAEAVIDLFKLDPLSEPNSTGELAISGIAATGNDRYLSQWESIFRRSDLSSDKATPRALYEGNGESGSIEYSPECPLLIDMVAVAGDYYRLRDHQRSARPAVEPQQIRYGISPYQDLAMPKIAERLDLYRKNNLNVELVTIAWEDIIPSLASGGKTVDVAIGSVNTFLPRAENINLQGGGEVVFYAPLWVFKGASLMMQPNSGMQPLSAFVAKYPSDRDRAIKEAMLQLRGKTIAVPEGTTFDQMLVAGLKIAGMNPKSDANIRHVKLDDGVYAFLGRDVDVVGAGVTQRTELMRNGGSVFLDMESFGFAEITGIMTTRHFAAAHPEELTKLVQIWYESVRALFSNVDTQSEYLRAYLDKAASTKYTLEEYKRALEFQEFPRSATEAEALFVSPDGKFYWKRNWDIINAFLLDTKKITRPIPYEYFMGEKR